MDRQRRPDARTALVALGVLLAALSSGLIDTLPAEAGTAPGTGSAAQAQGRSAASEQGRTQPPHTGPRGAGGIQDAPATGFDWPLAPKPTVSSPFQPPSRPYGPGHRGADLIGDPGQPVLAAGDGVVLYAGPLADRGVLSILHPGGLRTTYEPVAAIVHPGRLVHEGEPIGTLEPGHAGCPVAACLHWGLLRDRTYLDPLQLVRAGTVRLYPFGPVLARVFLRGPHSLRFGGPLKKNGSFVAGRACGHPGSRHFALAGLLRPSQCPSFAGTPNQC